MECNNCAHNDYCKDIYKKKNCDAHQTEAESERAITRAIQAYSSNIVPFNHIQHGGVSRW